jgi:hypothetical protein
VNIPLPALPFILRNYRETRGAQPDAATAGGCVSRDGPAPGEQYLEQLQESLYKSLAKILIG